MSLGYTIEEDKIISDCIEAVSAYSYQCTIKAESQPGVKSKRGLHHFIQES